MKHLQQAHATLGLSAMCISSRYFFGANSCQAACCGLAGSGGGGALTCIPPYQPAPTATHSFAKGRCRCGGDTAPAGAGTNLQSCALPRGLGLSRQHPDSCL